MTASVTYGRPVEMPRAASRAGVERYARRLGYLVPRETPFIALVRSCCFAVYIPFFLLIFEQKGVCTHSMLS